MYSHLLCNLTALPLLIISLTSTSCIFEAPDDDFFRTLWKADEAPLKSFSVEELTLEFLCENGISLETSNNSIINYGNYRSNGHTAEFYDLNIRLEGHTITFTDAQRSGNTLFLRRKTDDSSDLYTTTMRRLSAYE